MDGLPAAIYPLLGFLLTIAVSHAEDKKLPNLLGHPPTPAELVAMQPNFRKLYTRIGQPQTLTLSRETKAAIENRFNGKFQGERRHGRMPLGPTGAIVWDTKHVAAMPVVGFYPGTPAEKVLRLNDVIVGANGRLLIEGEDPRVPLCYAVYEAYSQLKALRLNLGDDREDMAALWQSMQSADAQAAILRNAQQRDKTRSDERNQWTEPLTDKKAGKP